MILYALQCPCGHGFDQWFDNMADYEERKDQGRLACPVCGGRSVDKAIMAPRLGKAEAPHAPAPCGAPSCGGGGMCPMMGNL